MTSRKRKKTPSKSKENEEIKAIINDSSQISKQEESDEQSKLPSEPESAEKSQTKYSLRIKERGNRQEASPNQPKETNKRKKRGETVDDLNTKNERKLEHRRNEKLNGNDTAIEDISMKRLSSLPLEFSPVREGMGNTKRVEEDIAMDGTFMDAVVKVLCTHTEPNFSLPWQRKRQYSSSSSGFIIGGRRVLTNAHSVEHFTQVKLKRRGSDTKFLATVLAIGTECDIALLTVEDERFWDNVDPLEFGDLPHLQDAVSVVGYPIGGDTISVTSGVVSRIEVTSYVHGASELLAVQIDAAINSGNSGGPAFSKDKKCVGIAFQSLKDEDVENIGYVIPTPVIQHFISDYEKHKAYTGFPVLGIDWQKMESPDLREYWKMGKEEKGVRIRKVQPTSPSFPDLREDDIILSFDDIPIANDGTIPFRQGERISFNYLVSQKYVDDFADLTILREGEKVNAKVKLGLFTRLVPVHINNLPPSYFIIAGIVFTPLTVPYLRSEYGKEYDLQAPISLLNAFQNKMAEIDNEQMIVVSQVLAADVNVGYEDIYNTQVFSCNGEKIMNLKQLVEIVTSCKEKYLRFDLGWKQVMVLETEKAKKSTNEILVTHCISSPTSPDLLPLK